MTCMMLLDSSEVVWMFIIAIMLTVLELRVRHLVSPRGLE
jgi:hypothetical protein